MKKNEEKHLGGDERPRRSGEPLPVAADVASHVAIWEHRFFEDSSALCEFFGSLNERQAGLAKVTPGKKSGYAIYGWDVLYPARGYRV